MSHELLNAGARILEINAVRRHISQVNGGRLAQKIEQTGAELINLILWDVVGDDLKSNLEEPSSFYGTPVGPDNTTLAEAIKVIEKYNLWRKIPKSVISYLRSERDDLETPKDLGDRVCHFVLHVPIDACVIAKSICEKKGIPGYILTTSLEGESREAGIFLASIAKEISLYNRPVDPPCFLIAGGETTVNVGENPGKGGPNQEVVLSFAQEIAGFTGISIAALGTDGTDGPTDFAGGLADSTTGELAELSGMELYEFLNRHDAYEALKGLDDGIITGNTGTNLCDLILVYISAS